LMEEVWMEAILLSVDGDREEASEAIAYARSILKDIVFADSVRMDSHVYMKDLSDRLAKLYELSRGFNEAQPVSAALIDELAMLMRLDYEKYATAVARSVMDLLAWQLGDELKQQYIVDLAQTMKMIGQGYNKNLKKALRDKMALLVEDNNSEHPELGKIYFNLTN